MKSVINIEDFGAPNSPGEVGDKAADPLLEHSSISIAEPVPPDAPLDEHTPVNVSHRAPQNPFIPINRATAADQESLQLGIEPKGESAYANINKNSPCSENEIPSQKRSLQPESAASSPSASASETEAPNSPRFEERFGKGNPLNHLITRELPDGGPGTEDRLYRKALSNIEREIDAMLVIGECLSSWEFAKDFMRMALQIKASQRRDEKVALEKRRVELKERETLRKEEAHRMREERRREKAENAKRKELSSTNAAARIAARSKQNTDAPAEPAENHLPQTAVQSDSTDRPVATAALPTLGASQSEVTSENPAGDQATRSAAACSHGPDNCIDHSSLLTNPNGNNGNHPSATESLDLIRPLETDLMSQRRKLLATLGNRTVPTAR